MSKSILLALSAIALAANVSAQTPDPAKRVEFLEAAVASYSRQVARLSEQLAVAEATNQVLQKQVDEAARAAKQPAPDAKK